MVEGLWVGLLFPIGTENKIGDSLLLRNFD